MTDLVAFLRARLDEDEAVARLPTGRVYADDHGPDRSSCVEVATETWADGEDRLPNHHNVWYPIHDQARVLADVEAKRRIIREATYWIVDARPVSPNARQFATDVLRVLATPYADHPDFDESWRVA